MFLQVTDICKTFGSFTALSGLSLSVNKSEVFGLLGPNGAGKSTFISILNGLIEPSSGDIQFPWGNNQVDPTSRHKVGLAPQELGLYLELSAEENLTFFAQLYGLSGAKLRERVNWALALAKLEDRRNDPVENFSGGMKRRLNLACALIHEPEFVCLDEPTVGVDPQSRRHIFDTILELKNAGLTILYTTHYMEEAAELCDRIAIMDHGKVLALGTHDELIHAHGAAPYLQIKCASKPDSIPDCAEIVDDHTLVMKNVSTEAGLRAMAEAGLKIDSINVVKADLESVFLTLTGRPLRD